MQATAQKSEVDIPFDELFSLIERLPAEQKMKLFERLKFMAFKENWLALSKEIISPGFTEDEIAAEIQGYRDN